MKKRPEKHRPILWGFTAKTADELQRIGNALFTARTQKHLDEQVQMTRMLEAISTTPVLHFPLRVRHTGESEAPDFQLASGKRLIAVEAAKIAVQDVEHARGLQQKGFNRTLSISSLYRKQSKPRTKTAVISEGFLIPAMVFPVSIEEHSRIWSEETAIQLNEKTAILKNSHFAHGDEDWLLLWDRIGTADWERDARLKQFNSLLSPYWKQGWYPTVCLQDEDFRWLGVFTAQRYFLVCPPRRTL